MLMIKFTCSPQIQNKPSPLSLNSSSNRAERINHLSPHSQSGSPKSFLSSDLVRTSFVELSFSTFSLHYR